MKASPCPFCKSDDLEVCHSLEGPAFVVKCWGCGAVGPYGSSNAEMAVDEWNMRDIPNGKRETSAQPGAE